MMTLVTKVTISASLRKILFSNNFGTDTFDKHKCPIVICKGILCEAFTLQMYINLFSALRLQCNTLYKFVIIIKKVICLHIILLSYVLATNSLLEILLLNKT